MENGEKFCPLLSYYEMGTGDAGKTPCTSDCAWYLTITGHEGGVCAVPFGMMCQDSGGLHIDAPSALPESR